LKDNTTEQPLLINILDILEKGFQFIINNLKTFYKSTDENVVYLTIFQEPMLNGLNAEPFVLQNSSDAMIDRMLSILTTFLVSNQEVRLDETFILYINVLSVEHSEYKRTIAQRKQPNTRRGRKMPKYGYRTCSKNYTWALDVPMPIEPAFQHSCLLIACIIANSLNNYYKTDKNDKTFLYFQSINSKYKHKKQHGLKLLQKNLIDVINTLNS
jgi:hypothetical protein